MPRFTAFRRTLALLLAACLGAVAGVAVVWPDSSGAATNTVYSKTIAGSDMVSLNPNYLPSFVDGGGTQAVVSSTHNPQTYNYFEGALNLPVGARVTSITISYISDGVGLVQGAFYVGSYAPASRNTVGAATINPPYRRTPGSFTRSGTPLLTVAAGRRYVLDWAFSNADGPTDRESDVFYGATVRYTCTAPCAP